VLQGGERSKGGIMKDLNWLRAAWAVCVLCLTAGAITASAQTFKSLFTFSVTEGPGYNPEAGLIQGTDGNLYGTTVQGSPNGAGAIFKITPSGTVTTLHDFCAQSGCADGGNPVASLVQGADGNLYGTTSGGGEAITPECNGCGTVFKITPDGTFTLLYSFCSETGCADGQNPYAGLVQGIDGNFYGTTAGGGANGGGTVFRITPSGDFTTLYSFCSEPNCADGQLPEAGLIQATDGNLYGTTLNAGANTEGGVVFRITPNGEYTVIYNFCSTLGGGGCGDGKYPSGLVEAADGDFYGVTHDGGANGPCYSQSGCGTVFRITPAGTLTTLYSFCSQTNCADGDLPAVSSGLVQGTDGKLYGTTYSGGADCSIYCGTAFRITTSGAFTTLYSFCSKANCGDGDRPAAPLVQDTNGKFYGTTLYGGLPDDSGTVYRLTVGLGPFVKTVPTASKAGRSVIILGTNLQGATSVSFNGIPANFTVESPTTVKTSVPSGATTGPIQVVTPSGTLTSNVSFQVLP
jgi:uncharacterized repeat protein (TIGR03803 family)